MYNLDGGIMFERTELIIGKDNLEKLNRSSVLVIGLGGVGGYVVEALVRSGIGKLIIVDNDIVDITNLNRQIIATEEVIGLPKVDVMENRIKSINPNCEVIKLKEFILPENIDLLFQEKIDFLVDACDTIVTKKSIIFECLKREILFISSMGSGNKINPLKFKITDLRKTNYDPIAKILRKMVKEEKLKGNIPVVWSDEKPIKSRKVGSLMPVVATSGLLSASYVLGQLLGEKNA